MADYDFNGAKWGARTLGTSGGQVTWSFAEALGYFYAFDARISSPAFQALVRDAFAAWESVANIDFVEVSDSSAVDIRLGWDAIDGRHNIIGQAQFSYSTGSYGQMIRSEVRFDTAEQWSTSKDGSYGGTNFYAVAVHEIGHAIGLGHSDEADSIMYGTLQYQTGLSADDVAGAQALYGPAVMTSRLTAPSYPGTAGTDNYVGSAGADDMKGGAGNDIFRGAGGDDRIDGGTGLDVAVYGGRFEDYVVTTFSTGASVRDVRSGSPDGLDQLTSIERLHFSDGTLALDIEGAAGQAHRLYQAAFARTPDNDGLEFWINAIDAGQSLYSVGQGFASSTEFALLYRHAETAQDFVEQLYFNILDRPGERAGVDYWTDAIASGRLDEAALLIGFSESAENRSGVAPAISDGIWYA